MCSDAQTDSRPLYAVLNVFSGLSIYVCLCVSRGGWKLVFVWFSSFPVAFKWACWIQPSSRTALPESLMEPLLSIRHPGICLRATLSALGCLGLVMRYSVLSK